MPQAVPSVMAQVPAVQSSAVHSPAVHSSLGSDPELAGLQAPEPSHTWQVEQSMKGSWLSGTSTQTPDWHHWQAAPQSAPSERPSHSPAGSSSAGSSVGSSVTSSAGSSSTGSGTGSGSGSSAGSMPGSTGSMSSHSASCSGESLFPQAMRTVARRMTVYLVMVLTR